MNILQSILCGLASAPGLIAMVMIVLNSGCDRSGNQSSRPTQNPEPDVTLLHEISLDDSIVVGSFKMKGERGRMDGEEGLSSMLYEPINGGTHLDHTMKTYFVMPKASTDKSEISPAHSAAIAAALQLRFTGRKKKIREWECEEFVVCDSMGKDVPRGMEMRLVHWVTNDLEGGEAIQARYDQMNVSSVVDLMGSVTSRKIAVPGFVVRTEVTRGAAQTVTTTRFGVSFEPLDDKIFLIPSGYKDAAWSDGGAGKAPVPEVGIPTR